MLNQYLEQVGINTDNPEPRCACVLLLDVSSSMSGKRIRLLNEGLQAFQRALQADDLACMRVEVGIVTFGGRVDVAQKFMTADEFMPSTLTTTGDTPMGEAINMAMDMIDQRKKVYRQNGLPYYRPWIFLVTDGYPTARAWQAAAQRVKEAEATQKVAFFAVGVEGADMKCLSQISMRQPVKLKGLNFREMFVWLSGSLTAVSHSQIGEQVPLESPVGWAAI